jgi:hypothetical protein
VTRQELSAQVQSAMEAYRIDPNSEHASNLRQIVHGLRHDLSSIGPSLGILDGVAEMHPYPTWARSVLSVVGHWIIKKFVLTPDRPAWNDYWMCRWMVTGDPAAIDEIHRRALHYPQPGAAGSARDRGLAAAVMTTAQWMVRSVRQQNSDFDAAYHSAEVRCPICRSLG